MRLCARKVSALLAGRHVRRLSLHSADRLMEAATVRGSGHKGNRDWLAEHQDVYGHCYLIPAPDTRLVSLDIRCVLVLLSGSHQAVWMSLDVSPWEVLRLPRLRGREIARVMGWLAAGNPVVRWDGTLTP